jgi:hypothetical protein
MIRLGRRFGRNPVRARSGLARAVVVSCLAIVSAAGIAVAQDDPLAAAAQPVPSGAPAPSVVLHRTIVMDTDPAGIPGPALTLLAPEGWIVEGGPVWRPQFSNLVSVEGRVVSPDRRRGVEFFPLVPQIWMEGGITFFPPGTNYLGNEVGRPIRDARAYVESRVLPAHRGAFGARVIGTEALPEVAAAFAAAALPGTEVVAERVLTEHFVGGERMLEELTVVLTFTPNPYVPGAVLWGPQQLFSIRAPEAELEADRPLLTSIATSPIVDARWWAGYQVVLDMSLRNGLEAIRAAGRASEIIARSNADISEIITSGYRERQAATDRVFDEISLTVRGYDTYADPWAGDRVSLPIGYSYAYGSAEGSYILTDDPAFDPVQEYPEETWQMMLVDRG